MWFLWWKGGWFFPQPFIPWVRRKVFTMEQRTGPGRHPFHEAGSCSEPSAMAVAELDPLPGERILDLCAHQGEIQPYLPPRLKRERLSPVK